VTKKIISPLVAGLLVAASMPPWGWWPLAFFGLAWYGKLALQRRDSALFLTALSFGVGWFLPAFAWMWFLTIPGYLVVVLLFASLHGVAALLSRSLARTDTSFTIALVVCHSLVEALRASWPFGGVPLATVAHSQAASPIASVSPYVGSIGIAVIVFWIAFTQRKVRAFFITTLFLILANSWDATSDAGTTVRITAVQGGGPQGTHAIYTNDNEVFNRHLTLTQTLVFDAKRTAVVWPENVIDMDGTQKFVGSFEHSQLKKEARRLRVPIVVGITEDIGPTGFTNAVVVVEPDGMTTERYDKVRRVPFGEYMPGRQVFSAMGISSALLPRDATAGASRARVTVAGTQVATPISWEVFFGGRVNEGVSDGAGYIINPTNGSSYTWTILQSQQVASSRLRAREQGRWVVQISPTGFSAFVSPSGTVLQRTKVSEEAVIEHTFPVRTGRTPYSRLGNGVYIALLVLGLSLLARQRARAIPRGAS
jgi:apolipoprotein N-acyltransferase